MSWLNYDLATGRSLRALQRQRYHTSADEEVKEATSKMKIRKAGGPTEETSDIMKAMGESSIKRVTEICNKVAEKKIPKEWKNAIKRHLETGE